MPTRTLLYALDPELDDTKAHAHVAALAHLYMMDKPYTLVSITDTPPPPEFKTSPSRWMKATIRI